MVIVMIMAISEGDLTRLLYFVDYNGNRCGDGALANYKYTHWTHPANTGTNVCVQSCPSAAYIKFTLVTTQTVGDKNIGYTVGATPDTATNCALTYANCATALSTATPAQLIAQGKADCCTFSAAPAPGGLYICVPAAVGTGSANQAKEYVDSSSALIVAATQDLITGWYIILCSALIAVIVSYIWLVVLKYSAGCFVWSIVFVANIFCFVATGAMYYLYDKYKTAYDDTALGQDQQMMYLCLIGLAIFGLLALILFCMTVCLCRQIAIAIKIIEAACDAINDIPSSVYFPLLQYFLMLIFIVYWVLVAAYMMSTGDYKQVSGAYTMEWNETMQQAFVYHFFGLLWVMAFIRHMSILILAGAFGTWYWTSIPDKDAGKFQEKHPTPIMSSIWRSNIYHTGTVAFGSFIIAVIQFIQACLEYLKQKQDSEWMQYLISCIQCIVECFERIMEYISRMAYIVTACKGNMFCTAAMESFGFIFKHMGQHAIVGYVTVFLMVLGQLFILCGTVAICFILAGTNSDISSPYVLLIVCGLIAYIVACLFLGVLDTAIDTIMVCFCWEQDANGAMENEEGERMIYGTNDLIQYIDGAKKMADEHASGGKVHPEPAADATPAATEPA